MPDSAFYPPGEIFPKQFQFFAEIEIDNKNGRRNFATPTQHVALFLFLGGAIGSLS
jgi:hypothetical protein